MGSFLLYLLSWQSYRLLPIMFVVDLLQLQTAIVGRGPSSEVEADGIALMESHLVLDSAHPIRQLMRLRASPLP
jgi:hypothetical protein